MGLGDFDQGDGVRFLGDLVSFMLGWSGVLCGSAFFIFFFFFVSRWLFRISSVVFFSITCVSHFISCCLCLYIHLRIFPKVTTLDTMRYSDDPYSDRQISWGYDIGMPAFATPT